MELYHLTDISVVEKILNEGLIPSIGEKSSLANESDEALYLCERKDLPFWQILLGRNAVVKAEVPKELVEDFSYSNYHGRPDGVRIKCH